MKYKPYNAYKDSGIEWLGKVPEHWDVKPLKRIVSVPITDGPHETPEILSEGIPFVSAEAVKNNQIDFSKVRGFISHEDHHRYALKYKPQKDDIYMIKSGATTGNLAIVDTDKEFNIWSPLAAIRTNKEIAYPKYVFHALNSTEFQTSVQLFWSYGTQQNIGMNVIENLVIPLPSLSEQNAVVNFLDKETGRIDTLIEKKRRMIELLKEKRIALISHAVTKGLDPNVIMKESRIEWLGTVPKHWEIKKLGHIAFLKSGENITAGQITDEDSYPVLGGNGLRGYTSDYTHNGHYVLIGRQGALCGNINYGVGKFWASEHAIVVSPLVSFETMWMGETSRAMNLNQYSISAAQPGLSVGMISSLKIPFPPIPEQHAIADYLVRETTKLDRMIQKVEAAIEKLTEYRTALITAAVTGKIDVREVAA